MNQADWSIVKEVFYTALNRPVAERWDFLDSACGDNNELRSEVEYLLESYVSGFLEEPMLSELAPKMPEPPIFEEGQIFSHFQIIRILGRGGMGQVFLAEDTSLDRRVAIKILPAEFAEDKERMSRFLREAKFDSALNHPNIVTIFEVGEAEGKLFFVTEFIDGETVREHLKRNRLSLGAALDISIQVATALMSAHSFGIVHRDIKPDNIMIRPDGVVKILDFGVAKLIERNGVIPSDNVAGNGTNPGMIVGTANYMSPEQARGQDVDQRTDIFNFGIVFYEMLTGKKAFEGEHAIDAIGAIIHKVPQSLSEILPGLPPRIAQILDRSLEKERDDRYQTSGELLDDLKEAKMDIEFYEKYPLVNDAERPTHLDAAFRVIKSRRIGALIAVTAVIAAVVGYGFWYSNDRVMSRERVNSIAVLPFENRSGSPDADYLSDGLADSMIFRLSQLPNLKVSPTSSVMQYKGTDVNVPQIAKDLKVDAVLFGRLIQRGDDLYISVELVDSRTDKLIWAEQYDRKMSDLLATQRELAASIIQRLQVKFVGNDNKGVSVPSTENNEAYQMYLKGRYLFAKRTKEGILSSIDLYRQAIKLDPQFALAYAGLADSYVLAPGLAGVKPQEAFPNAKSAATTALAIDDSLAEAHTALSYELFSFEWNFEESEREMKRAIELNPNYAQAYHWYGNANLLAMGRFDESIEAIKKAHNIDPLSLIINADLATSYCYALRLDEAIEQYEQTLELDHNFYYAHVYLGRAYLLKGNYQKALDELQKADGIGVDPRIPMLRSLIYSRLKRRPEALHMLDELKTMEKSQYVSNFDYALVYTGLGDFDNAFASLERSYALHDGNLVYIKADPLLADLRSDPRYSDIVKRMKLSQ